MNEYRVYGELGLYTVLDEVNDSVNVIKQYIDGIDCGDYHIQVSYRIDSINGNHLSFGLIVDTSIEAENADEAKDIVLNCLLYHLDFQCEFDELEVDSDNDEELYEDWFLEDEE